MGLKLKERPKFRPIKPQHPSEGKKLLSRSEALFKITDDPKIARYAKTVDELITALFETAKENVPEKEKNKIAMDFIEKYSYLWRSYQIYIRRCMPPEKAVANSEGLLPSGEIIKMSRQEFEQARRELKKIERLTPKEVLEIMRPQLEKHAVKALRALGNYYLSNIGKEYSKKIFVEYLKARGMTVNWGVIDKMFESLESPLFFEKDFEVFEKQYVKLCEEKIKKHSEDVAKAKEIFRNAAQKLLVGKDKILSTKDTVRILNDVFNAVQRGDLARAEEIAHTAIEREAKPRPAKVVATEPKVNVPFPQKPKQPKGTKEKPKFLPWRKSKTVDLQKIGTENTKIYEPKNFSALEHGLAELKTKEPKSYETIMKLREAGFLNDKLTLQLIARPDSHRVALTYIFEKTNATQRFSRAELEALVQAIVLTSKPIRAEDFRKNMGNLSRSSKKEIENFLSKIGVLNRHFSGTGYFIERPKG